MVAEAADSVAELVAQAAVALVELEPQLGITVRLIMAEAEEAEATAHQMVVLVGLA